LANFFLNQQKRDSPSARPTWLALAHKKLDAYGWPVDLNDEAILARLLGLNLERAGVV
jgi:hypothetical protein